MAQTPEGKVKQKIRTVLKAHNVYYTMPIGGAFSSVGVPDFLCCHKGKFIGIEAKAGSNMPTALQMKQLEDIRAAGGIALVVNESNVQQLNKILDETYYEE